MIYLDFAATSACHPQVWEAMTPYALTDFGNPASLHEAGQSAKTALEQARTTLLHLLGVSEQSHHLLFTSGGTEGNNIVLQGVLRRWVETHPDKQCRPHFIVSATEHSAVLAVAQHLERVGAIALTLLYPHAENEGRLTVAQLVEALTPETILCSVMHANNETGVLQPIEALVQAVKAHQPTCLFHSDMVQTIGKLPINLSALGVDFATASGHKFQAPKGAGFLVCSQVGFSALAPLCFGGSQEAGIRPGTVAVPHAVGLATALSLKLDALNQTHQHLTVLTAWLMEQLQTLFGERCVMNTPLAVNNRVAGIVNASFSPYLGEQLVLQLDIRGIAVSSGSACHAGLAVEPSAVLLAMGKPKAIAQSSVRVSMGATTTKADLQAFLSAMQSIIKLPVRSVETI